MIAGYDVIVDGTDNFDTRYVLNDAAVKLRKPVVHGSIYRWDGQVTTFVPFAGPCYRCMYPVQPPEELAPACAVAGVLGVLPGIAGMLQANEVFKLLLGVGETLAGRLLMFDAMTTEFSEVRIWRDPGLPGLRRGVAMAGRAGRRRGAAGSAGMSSVRIPPVLREEVGGQRVVEATGGSVSEVLDQLFATYPVVGRAGHPGREAVAVRERLRQRSRRPLPAGARHRGRAERHGHPAAGHGRRVMPGPMIPAPPPSSAGSHADLVASIGHTPIGAAAAPGPVAAHRAVGQAGGAPIPPAR